MVKVSWRDVLISNAEGRSADEQERFYALATCRSSVSGVPWGGWFFLPPATAVKVAHRDDAHYFGPRCGQIDWAGFGVALVLRALQRAKKDDHGGLDAWILRQLADVADGTPESEALFAELRAAGVREIDGLFYAPETSSLLKP